MAIVLGAVFGTGLVAAVYGMRPPRPALATTLTALNCPDVLNRESETDQSAGVLARAGRRAAPLLRAMGLPSAPVRADLLLAERSVEAHLASKGAAALVGLVTPWAATALFTLAAGTWSGWWVPASVSLLLGVALFFAPDHDVRQVARRRRDELRHTLATVLDLTVIALAGGAGLQQALNDASLACRGWAASQIRTALSTAAMNSSSPWHHLGKLGERAQVPDICELAASLSLAGTEGAKVRASLHSKARAMRRRHLAEAEGTARAATERMALPIMLQFLGFLVFIGTPALAHVLAGL